MGVALTRVQPYSGGVPTREDEQEPGNGNRNGEQGWRSGRALAFHQCGPGSIPGLAVISGLSLLVLYSAPRGFSPGTPVFPSPQKLTFDLI